MRELTSHKVNDVNDLLTVTAHDDPGPAGASHNYSIIAPNGQGTTLLFQHGQITENGVNGITHEVLLAILIDRFEGFQAGPFANPYNGDALAHLRSAARALHERTLERMARGVEGTNNT